MWTSPCLGTFLNLLSILAHFRMDFPNEHLRSQILLSVQQCHSSCRGRDEHPSCFPVNLQAINCLCADAHLWAMSTKQCVEHKDASTCRLYTFAQNCWFLLHWRRWNLGPIWLPSPSFRLSPYRYQLNRLPNVLSTVPPNSAELHFSCKGTKDSLWWPLSS